MHCDTKAASSRGLILWWSGPPRLHCDFTLAASSAKPGSIVPTLTAIAHYNSQPHLRLCDHIAIQRVLDTDDLSHKEDAPRRDQPWSSNGRSAPGGKSLDCGTLRAINLLEGYDLHTPGTLRILSPLCQGTRPGELSWSHERSCDSRLTKSCKSPLFVCQHT